MSDWTPGQQALTDNKKLKKEIKGIKERLDTIEEFFKNLSDLQWNNQTKGMKNDGQKDI